MQLHNTHPGSDPIPRKRVFRITIVRHSSRSEVGITFSIELYERKTDFSLPFRKY